MDEVLPWDHLSVGVNKQFMIDEYQHSLQGAVVNNCREHCFSCGIITQFKGERRQAQELLGGDGTWGCPSFGRDAARQPVSPAPVPLYFNDEMSPEITGQFDHRVPQRRGRYEQTNPAHRASA